MTEIEILINQTANAYEWTNKLLEAVPFEKWEIIPDTIESNMNWQVGHLIISHYFHSIMVIRGHQTDMLRSLPIKEYSELFTTSAPALSVGKTNALTLLKDLKIIQQKSLEILGTLSIQDLDNPLEPTPTAHPIATTKFEAIDWNIKHTMYHCGQIGILRRVVDHPYDFGLRLTR
ncbi:DinB family protein [Dyadobacter flavalbus]|uniref:DinB family protein n=2 Tax=Dyadobacter flavalbus TaxID=2579942 RepID=A0A5M8QZS9_9BACT|nr:DinB family protein [Dyadobacter flavalbus]